MPLRDPPHEGRTTHPCANRNCGRPPFSFPQREEMPHALVSGSALASVLATGCQGCKHPLDLCEPHAHPEASTTSQGIPERERLSVSLVRLTLFSAPPQPVYSWRKRCFISLLKLSCLGGGYRHGQKQKYVSSFSVLLLRTGLRAFAVAPRELTRPWNHIHRVASKAPCPEAVPSSSLGKLTRTGAFVST